MITAAPSRSLPLSLGIGRRRWRWMKVSLTSRVSDSANEHGSTKKTSFNFVRFIVVLSIESELEDRIIIIFMDKFQFTLLYPDK